MRTCQNSTHTQWKTYISFFPLCWPFHPDGLDWTGLDWTCTTRTSKTWTGKTRTSKTRTSRTRTGKTRTSKTGTGETRTSRTRTGKTRTSKTGTGETRTQDRLLRRDVFSFFFLDFFRVCKSEKTDSEQTFTKTNLRLEILFIYF